VPLIVASTVARKIDSALTTVSILEADLEGWLEKRGEYNEEYKRRWFILKDKYLNYFDTQQEHNPTNVTPKGCIMLESSSLKISSEKTHSFEIKTDVRTFFLRAENEQDFTSWIEKLSRVCTLQKDFTKEKLDSSVRNLADLSTGTKASENNRLNGSAQGSSKATEDNIRSSAPKFNINDLARSPRSSASFGGVTTSAGNSVPSDKPVLNIDTDDLFDGSGQLSSSRQPSSGRLSAMLTASKDDENQSDSSRRQHGLDGISSSESRYFQRYGLATPAPALGHSSPSALRHSSDNSAASGRFASSGDDEEFYGPDGLPPSLTHLSRKKSVPIDQQSLLRGSGGYSKSEFEHEQSKERSCCCVMM
jgi:hypothetical protein